MRSKYRRTERGREYCSYGQDLVFDYYLDLCLGGTAGYWAWLYSKLLSDINPIPITLFILNSADSDAMNRISKSSVALKYLVSIGSMHFFLKDAFPEGITTGYAHIINTVIPKIFSKPYVLLQVTKAGIIFHHELKIMTHHLNVYFCFNMEPYKGSCINRLQ